MARTYMYMYNDMKYWEYRTGSTGLECSEGNSYKFMCEQLMWYKEYLNVFGSRNSVNGMLKLRKFSCRGREREVGSECS